MNNARDNPAKKLAIIVCSGLIVLGCAGAAVSLFGGGSGGSSGGSSLGSANVEIVESRVLSPATLGSGTYAGDGLTYNYDENSELNLTTHSKDGVVGAEIGSEFYATVSDGSLFVGKNTASGLGALFIENSGNTEGEIYVFETDFKWCGSEYTSSLKAEDWYVKFALGGTYSNSIDNSSFFKAYIYGQQDGKYYSLSTSNKERTNEYILVKDYWYNLKIIYLPDDGEYSIFVNDKLIEHGNFSSSVSNTEFAGVYPEVRGYLPSAEIIFDNTYINAILTSTEE